MVWWLSAVEPLPGTTACSRPPRGLITNQTQGCRGYLSQRPGTTQILHRTFAVRPSGHRHRGESCTVDFTERLALSVRASLLWRALYGRLTERSAHLVRDGATLRGALPSVWPSLGPIEFRSAACSHQVGLTAQTTRARLLDHLAVVSNPWLTFGGVRTKLYQASEETTLEPRNREVVRTSSITF